MQQVAFLALSQAHQFLHWLPAALRLAREPGVEVHILSASRAGLDLVRHYDPHGSLHLTLMRVPSRRRDGLFSPPKRWLTLLLHHRLIGRFSTIVTTEATSSMLRRIPWFRSRIVYMMHGAGDRLGGYNPKLKAYDFYLAAGSKDKERLIAHGIGTEDCVAVTGYAKFELIRPPEPIFADAKPVALYNPHFTPLLSSWPDHGRAMIDALQRIPGWNFIIAPHVKLDPRARISGGAPNLIIDYGSVRSIDMSYAETAKVYVGDVSSQAYEFIRRPRPCIFLNLNRIDWRDNENFAHWHLGQVIEDIADLEPALERAERVQPQYVEAQRAAIARSIDPSPEPASERQARAILEYVRKSAR